MGLEDKADVEEGLHRKTHRETPEDKKRFEEDYEWLKANFKNLMGKYGSGTWVAVFNKEDVFHSKRYWKLNDYLFKRYGFRSIVLTCLDEAHYRRVCLGEEPPTDIIPGIVDE